MQTGPKITLTGNQIAVICFNFTERQLAGDVGNKPASPYLQQKPNILLWQKLVRKKTWIRGLLEDLEKKMQKKQ